MNHEDHIPEALEAVLARNVPEEILLDLVVDRARLCAGVNPDDIRECTSER